MIKPNSVCGWECVNYVQTNQKNNGKCGPYGTAVQLIFASDRLHHGRCVHRPGKLKLDPSHRSMITRGKHNQGSVDPGQVFYTKTAFPCPSLEVTTTLYPCSHLISVLRTVRRAQSRMPSVRTAHKKNYCGSLCPRSHGD